MTDEVSTSIIDTYTSSVTFGDSFSSRRSLYDLLNCFSSCFFVKVVMTGLPWGQ